MPRRNKRKMPKRNFKRNFKKQRSAVVETKRRESAQIQIANSYDGGGTGNPANFSSYYPDTTADTAVSSSVSLNMLPPRS